MEAVPGILRQRYEKRRRHDVERQAPSLRTESLGSPRPALFDWTSHDHKWDPSVLLRQGSRNGPAAGDKKGPQKPIAHPVPTHPPTRFSTARRHSRSNNSTPTARLHPSAEERSKDARAESRSNHRSCTSTWVGRVMKKLAPRGELAPAHNRPSCDSMIDRLMDSPIPVP